MKKAKYVIIALACICLICGGFALLLQDNGIKEKELTAVEKVTTKNLEKDYPKTPREVVKHYNKIVELYYGEEIPAHQLDELVDQMMMLFDEDLALINPRDEYYKSVVADIERYKSLNKKIVRSDVSDSNDVNYLDDVKDGDSEVDELAYVDASYFVNTDGEFSYTYQRFVLRKDDDGRWKILTFYQIEGESSGDE